MATLQSDVCGTGTPPKAIHAGANVVRGRYIVEASSLSAGDVIQMVKIPNGAIVDDVVVAGGLDAGSIPGVVNIKVGDAGDDNRYISVSQSLATVIRATTGLGHKVSLSDDASVMYQTINITHVSGVVSISNVIDLIVVYHMDQ